VKGGYQYLTGAMVVLGEVLMAEDNLQAAKEQFQSTINIRQKVGEAGLVAETQIEMATLDLEEGLPDQAEPSVRQAITEFEKENAVPDLTSAYTLLSRVLLMEGKIEEARKTIQHAHEVGRSSPDPALNLPIAIQDARLKIAAEGVTRRAAMAATRKQLLSVISKARNLGYYELECEARLALGELSMNTRRSEARSQLAELAAEAHQHGLELIVRKAANLER
jgi:tetratricopeptide (TPR) repeat protein